MWIYHPGRRCATCGETDTIFFAQKQRENQITVNNKCIDCKKLERSEYYYKHDKYQRYLKSKENIYAQEKV